MIPYVLKSKSFLIFLLVVNILGTIYGYIWYGSQLAITPAKFLVFVPDSPTASLFFVIVLIYFLFDRNAPYIEALAVVTLFKYGIWAVVMNLLTMVVQGGLGWQGYMLIASHGAMAVQGLLYAPFYKVKLRHLVFAGIWTIHNDIIDYVFEMMPIYRSLSEYMPQIGYFTFWLSILSLVVAYVLTIRKNMHLSYKFRS